MTSRDSLDGNSIEVSKAAPTLPLKSARMMETGIHIPKTTMRL
jgi:hypothetical protein